MSKLIFDLIESNESTPKKSLPTIESEKIFYYINNKKNMGIAYVLWFFFGSLGMHRVYTGTKGGGWQALIFLLSWILLISQLEYIGAVSFITFAALYIWIFIDLFLIPGMIKVSNLNLINKLSIDPSKVGFSL